MRLQAEARGLVIRHHFFGERHLRQDRPAPLRPLVALVRVEEQRQILSTDKTARIPQRLPPRQVHRGEAVGAGEPIDMRRADSRAVAQFGNIAERPLVRPRGEQLGGDMLGQPIHLPQPQAQGEVPVLPAAIFIIFFPRPRASEYSMRLMH